MLPADPESDVIRILTRSAPGGLSRNGIGDDVAVLDDDTCVTVDALVEGVHWDEKLSTEDVGWKSVAVSVSDLAAAGARPLWMVLALSLPEPDPEWVAGFARGLGAAAMRWNVALIGGDTTGSPGPKIATVTMCGQLVARFVGRGGATVGDDVWVTGTLGAAGAGWMLEHPPESAVRKLRRPEPPLGFAHGLVQAAVPTAMMDLSDGLAADLPRLCARSGVGADIDPERIPAFADVENGLRYALEGGEDYELLFTANASARALIEALGRSHEVQVTRIGAIRDGKQVTLRGQDWPAGFRHFVGGK